VTLFKGKSRILRLLPGVMLVCGGLLVLKTSGVVHDAFALEATPGADAMAPAQQGANQDFAGGDDQMTSAAAVDVLTSLSKRRTAMDAREAEIQIEANMLAATEARVDTKIAQLKSLQTQIAALLGQRDAAQEKQVTALTKIYSAMKPKDAARIFDGLDQAVLLPVAQEMKSDALAPVLAAMNPDAAQKLTVKLAGKLALPDTAAVRTPLMTAPPAPTPAPPATPAPAPAANIPPPKPAKKTAAAKAPASSPRLAANQTPASVPSPAPAPGLAPVAASSDPAAAALDPPAPTPGVVAPAPSDPKD
jgi:flagellar motility protein MotE (MotC chaperone)